MIRIRHTLTGSQTKTTPFHPKKKSCARRCEPTYEGLLLVDVLVVVVESPVHLVVLLPLSDVLDLLRPVVDGPAKKLLNFRVGYKSYYN